MAPILVVIPVVVKAILAGGTLVAHAGGGMIVSGPVGGYVAGTFLSTTAINSILAVGATLGVGSAAVGASALGGIPKVAIAASRVKGVVSTLLAAKGVAASALAASEATGVLIPAGVVTTSSLAATEAAGVLVSAGVVSTTSVIVPIALSVAAVGLGYVIFKKYKSKEIVDRVYSDEEVAEVLVAINSIDWLNP